MPIEKIKDIVDYGIIGLLLFLSFLMLSGGDYSVKDLLNDVIAAFIVFGFFVLIAVFFKKFSNPQFDIKVPITPPFKIFFDFPFTLLSISLIE